MGHGRNRLVDGFPSIHFAHLNFPRSKQRPEHHGHGFRAWQHGLRLDTTAELPVEALDGVGRARLLPLRRIEPCESKEAVPCFFKAVGYSTALEAPFAQESLAPLLHLDSRVGVDHVTVVLGELVLHMVRGMRQKVAMLVNRAALDGEIIAPQRD
jgi:hypothetical protein